MTRTILVAMCVAGMCVAAGPATVPATSPVEGVIGVKAVEIDADVRSLLKQSSTPTPPGGGLLVVSIANKCPAMVAGIKRYDVLAIQFKGRTITTQTDFETWRQDLRPGVAVAFDVWRHEVNRLGSQIWRKEQIKLTPVTRQQFDDDQLRCSYLKVDGEWMKIPDMDLSKDSSPPPEDSKAVNPTMLLKLKVGAYGKIKSCRVTQVVGDDDVISEIGWDELGVTRIGVPNDGTGVRMIGFHLKNAVDGKTYPIDERIAVVGTWKYVTAIGGTRTIFMAVPLQRLKDGLNDAELEDLKKSGVLK